MATTTPKPKRRSASASDSLAAWIAKSDRGPHRATLPSGQKVTFAVPDLDDIIRSQRLPKHLTELAIMAAAYPDGVDGYVSDLAVNAAAGRHETAGDAKEAALAVVAGAMRDRIEYGYWLISQMLVDPAVKPEQVPQLPEPDREMLLEFADRRRDRDAEGVKLPIALTETFARFRDKRNGGEGDAARESDGDELHGVDGGSDGGGV
jgi:hypothetical protein